MSVDSAHFLLFPFKSLPLLSGMHKHSSEVRNHHLPPKSGIKVRQIVHDQVNNVCIKQRVMIGYSLL